MPISIDLNHWKINQDTLLYRYLLDTLSIVNNASKCDIGCGNSDEVCGGDGGFLSVYWGDSMIPGAPKDLTFDVEMDPMVNEKNSIFSWRAFSYSKTNIGIKYK